MSTDGSHFVTSGGARGRQPRIGPVGHVAGDAVARVARFEAQFLRPGEVNVHGFRRVRRPQDAAVETPLAVHEDAEDHAAACAARLDSQFRVEAGILAFQQHLDGAIRVMAQALAVGLLADLERHPDLSEACAATFQPNSPHAWLDKRISSGWSPRYLADAASGGLPDDWACPAACELQQQ